MVNLAYSLKSYNFLVTFTEYCILISEILLGEQIMKIPVNNKVKQSGL